MLKEIYTRRIKTVSGDGTGTLKITPTKGVRIHQIQAQLTYAAGVNTLAALMAHITEIRYKVGTAVRCRLNGTKLRDWMLLFGTTFDFNGLPNTGAQITFPFSYERFLDNVEDSLAWDPVLLGNDITLELDSDIALTTIWYEVITEDAGTGASAGIITLEVINPVAGGTQFYVGKEIDARGRLLAASIYPDSNNNNEITPVTLYLGPGEAIAHERLTSAQNDELLERYSLTPAAAGRSANIYDIVPVRADLLSRGYDLGFYGEAKLSVEAAAAMAGTCSILLARFENK